MQRRDKDTNKTIFSLFETIITTRKTKEKLKYYKSPETKKVWKLSIAYQMVVEPTNSWPHL